ncbi:hypothetical protein D3C76_1319950 [compost metagenome]
MDHGVDAVYPQHGNHAGMYFHEHGGAVHSPVPVHQDLVGFLALLPPVHEGLVRRDIGHPGHAVLVCGLQGLNAHGPQLGQAVPVEVQSGFVGVHDSSVCRVYQQRDQMVIVVYAPVMLHTGLGRGVVLQVFA